MQQNRHAAAPDLTRADFFSDPDATSMPWLESPFGPYLLDSATHMGPVARQVARRFMEDGYVIVDIGLGEKETNSVVSALEDRYERLTPEGIVRNGQLHNAWEQASGPARDAMVSVANNQVILDIIRVLYRREPIPCETINFRKGTEQRTHSDAIHLDSVPRGYTCSVWVALEDVHPDAGPIHFYPGSHRWPAFGLQDLGLSASKRLDAEGQPELYGEGYQRYEDFVQSLASAAGVERESFLLKRGQAVIWSSNLLHGGNPIEDPRMSLHAQQIRYAFEGPAYFSALLSDPFLNRIAFREIRDIRTGSLVQGSIHGEPVGALNSEEWVQPPAMPVPELLGSEPKQQVDHDLTYTPDCIVACPRFEEAEIRRLAQDWLKPLSALGEFRLCLRHASELDPPMAEAIEVTDRVLNELIGDEIDLAVHIISDKDGPRDWSDIQRASFGSVLLDPVGTERSTFLLDLGLPTCSTLEELTALFPVEDEEYALAASLG